MSSVDDSERTQGEVRGELVPIDEEVRIAPEKAKKPSPARRAPRPVPVQPRGCWGTCALFSGASLLVLTLVFAFLVVVMIVNVSGFLRNPVDNFLGVFGFDRDAVPQEVDSRTVVLGIREMALLQTASGDIQITKTVVDTGPAPDAELAVSYVGHVTAGIDLAQMSDEDLVINSDGSLTVMLPPAHLTGCFLGKPEVLARSCTDIPFVQDCGRVIQGLHDKAYDRALEELRETAVEMNLIDLAYGEAETRIYELLRQLGYDTVRFERSAEILPAAESCFP